MNYQWYPGHMTKAIRMMQEDIKLIDLVIEIVDARIPVASRNPEIDKLATNKGRLILLNKSDLADKKCNDAWIKYYKEKGITALMIDSRNGVGLKDIQNAVQVACKDKIERDRKKGIQNRPLRAMVCGIPNVGKSTFINAYAKKACAKTGNKPGVTKGKQWIRLDKNLELLDTPGILWPKFEDKIVGLHLAMIGSINDEILESVELALEIIEFMNANYKGRIEERYKLDSMDLNAFVDEDELMMMPDALLEKAEGYKMLHGIAKSRGCLLRGAELDLQKAADIVIDEFRSGRLGKVTIEFAGE